MNPPANEGDPGDVGSVPRSRSSLGVRNGNPLQYSCLGNPWTEEPDRLQSMGLQKNWTRLSDWTDSENTNTNLTCYKLEEL